MSSIRSEQKTTDNQSVAEPLLALARVRQIIVALKCPLTVEHGIADLIKWKEEEPLRGFVEEGKKKNILFSSPRFIELFDNLQKKNKAEEGRVNLIDLLDKHYQYLIIYLKEHEQRKLPKAMRPTDTLEKTRRYANAFGIATGEVSSVTFSIVTFLQWAEKYQLLNLLITKSKPLLGPFSYFFYGWVSLVYCYKKIKHLFRERLPGNESLLPQRFLISDTLSAGANLLVFIMYMNVAVIYASSLLLTIPWLTGGICGALLGLAAASKWAMTIAAVGTFIGWLGNEVVNAWRANKEMEESNELGKLFSKPKEALKEIKINKKTECLEAREQRNRGIFMVVGMVFLALSGLVVSPIVPFIPFEISAFTAATIVCMTVYASKVIFDILELIGKGVAWLAQALCCCSVGNNEDGKRLEASRQASAPSFSSTHSTMHGIPPAAGVSPVEYKRPPVVLSAAEGRVPGGQQPPAPPTLQLQPKQCSQ